MGQREKDHARRRCLLGEPAVQRVLITPHISGGTDVAQHRVVEVFSDNLRAYLEGRPLVVVGSTRRTQHCQPVQ